MATLSRGAEQRDVCSSAICYLKLQEKRRHVTPPRLDLGLQKRVTEEPLQRASFFRGAWTAAARWGLVREEATTDSKPLSTVIPPRV